MPLRVLHVEDDSFASALVAAVLDEAGIEAIWAGSGRTALGLAAEVDLDAIVLDLALPDMGGDELARQLGQAVPEVPLLVLTGTPEAAPAGLPVLAKPFTGQALLEELARLVGEPARV